METARKMAILKDAAQRIKSFGFKVYICVGESGLAWGVYSNTRNKAQPLFSKGCSRRINDNR